MGNGKCPKRANVILAAQFDRHPRAVNRIYLTRPFLKFCVPSDVRAQSERALKFALPSPLPLLLPSAYSDLTKYSKFRPHEKKGRKHANRRDTLLSSPAHSPVNFFLLAAVPLCSIAPVDVLQEGMSLVLMEHISRSGPVIER